MSIWTSKAPAFATLVVASLLLAACFESVSLSRATSRGGEDTSGPSAVAVLDGSVTVTGPAGYCVDETATRESDTEAFVLLVRCAATSRNSPILSATVTGQMAPGTAAPENLARLGAFLDTRGGRVHLSRSGNAADVQIIETRVDDGMLLLRIEDSGNPDTIEPGYWRAILPVAERVITLSVLSSRAHPVGEERSLMVLRDFVLAMRSRNAP
ncbi:MAG: hypothetical protein JJU15_15240 [Pararhodobacter sp.]|nr:hypothetical protein [Pararhodobacter sp.]